MKLISTLGLMLLLAGWALAQEPGPASVPSTTAPQETTTAPEPNPGQEPTTPATQGQKIGDLPVPDWVAPDSPNAETAPRQAKKLQGYNPSAALFDMLSKLLMVLGLIILLAWLTQKYLPKRMGALGESKNLKLIQSLPLGPRRFVSLIEADGRRFLIGVTDNQINLLKALDEIPFENTFAQNLSDEPRTVTELLEQEP